MLHELCYPGLRVLLEGEPVTVSAVRPTSIIVKDKRGGMLAAKASDLTPVMPGTATDVD